MFAGDVLVFVMPIGQPTDCLSPGGYEDVHTHHNLLADVAMSAVAPDASFGAFNSSIKRRPRIVVVSHTAVVLLSGAGTDANIGAFNPIAVSGAYLDGDLLMAPFRARAGRAFARTARGEMSV